MNTTDSEILKLKSNMGIISREAVSNKNIFPTNTPNNAISMADSAKSRFIVFKFIFK